MVPVYGDDWRPPVRGQQGTWHPGVPFALVPELPTKILPTLCCTCRLRTRPLGAPRHHRRSGRVAVYGSLGVRRP
jgi:hypothetical protein